MLAEAGLAAWAGVHLVFSPLPGGLAVHDGLDHRFRVGEGERTVRIGNIPLERPAGRRGEFADMVGHAVSLSLANSRRVRRFPAEPC